MGAGHVGAHMGAFRRFKVGGAAAARR